MPGRVSLPFTAAQKWVNSWIIDLPMGSPGLNLPWEGCLELKGMQVCLKFPEPHRTRANNVTIFQNQPRQVNEI